MASQMPMRVMGNTGMQVSVLSFGFYNTFASKPGLVDAEGIAKAKACLRVAREAGVNFFDNAEVYGEVTGGAEEVMGKAIEELREEDPLLWRRADLIIATKLFWGGSGVNENGLSRKHLREGIKGSLERLKVDYIDFLFAHRPDPLTPTETIVRAMSELIEQGKILHWGTSLWSAQQLTEAFWIAQIKNLQPPMFEQPQYNMFHRTKLEVEYYPLFRAPYNMGTTCWGALAGGLLTGKYAGGVIPEGSRLDADSRSVLKAKLDQWMADGTMDKVDTLVRYAQGLGCSVGQLAIAWTIRNTNCTTNIIGASSAEQLEHSLHAVQVAKKMQKADDIAIEMILSNTPDAYEGYGGMGMRHVLRLETEETPLRTGHNQLPLMASRQDAPMQVRAITRLAGAGGRIADGKAGPPRGAVKYGWLTCSVGSGLGLAQWAPRWCVLTIVDGTMGLITQYRDAASTEILETVQFSSGATVDHFKLRPFGFVINKVNRQIHHFDAENSQSLAIWMSAVEFVTQQLRHQQKQPAQQITLAAQTAVGSSHGDGVRKPRAKTFDADMETPVTVILFGATGDLARKKLYPALYQLMFGAPDAPLLPRTTRVVGYGRQAVELRSFLDKQAVNVKGEFRENFLAQCSFYAGAYDQESSYVGLHTYLCELEGGGKANRIFFFSVPPTIFGDVCRCVKAQAQAPEGGYTRLIIEKPFGRDSASFEQLNKVTSASFSEESLFRIDHYLGKEVVLNMTTMRFGNQLFEAVWNKDHIASVQIVFKEDLGTGGRGGYFDQFGIIRDIMQNHLLQVLLWFAMEPPEDLSRESVGKEKVKLLQRVRTLKLDDCFLGQFTKNSWMLNGVTHIEPGYLDDETVPAGSTCPTYAAVALMIDNERWAGVPFMMRAGKALDERMAEVRVTFKKKGFNKLVPGGSNELIMRIQPEEAVYLKCQNKMPGWHQDHAVPVVLDMSYSTAFPDTYVADAYERMFLNTFKGDGSLFVGSEELTEAWRIFTPLLNQIEQAKPEPVMYPFGVRVPQGMDEFSAKYGIEMGESWHEYLAKSSTKMQDLEAFFNSLDIDGNGFIDSEEIRGFASKFFDGRVPSDKHLAQIVARMDTTGEGQITFKDFIRGIESIAGRNRADDEPPNRAMD